jgi:hypothetical protein
MHYMCAMKSVVRDSYFGTRFLQMLFSPWCCRPGKRDEYDAFRHSAISSAICANSRLRG